MQTQNNGNSTKCHRKIQIIQQRRRKKYLSACSILCYGTQTWQTRGSRANMILVTDWFGLRSFDVSHYFSDIPAVVLAICWWWGFIQQSCRCLWYNKVYIKDLGSRTNQEIYIPVIYKFAKSVLVYCTGS